MNIALISPAKEVYSETFIKAHWEGLRGNIFYLYGGFLPEYSDKGFNFKKPLPRAARWGNSIGTRLRLSKYKDSQTYHIKQFFKKNRIDAVLAEYGPTGVEMHPICRELNIPMLVHFHGYDAYSETILSTYKERYQEFLKTVEAIVVVSKDMQEQVINLGAEPNRIYLNSCGVDNVFLESNPDYNSNYFLSVGRFVDKKAPYLTILAFKQVHDIFPEARLRMVGDGVLFNTCVNLVTQFGLRQAVEFCSILSHEKVQNVMQQSFCFIQHSITATNGDKEGTPVAILEASASALPVISTLHAGIPEAVKHEETGFLVAEQDVNAMVKYMIELYKNREQARVLGQNGRLYIQQNYSMEEHLSALNLIIQEIIHSTR